MGRIPTGRRKYQLKCLNETHLEIVRLIAQGKRNKDIAKELSLSRDTVSNVRNSELAKPILERLLKERDHSAASMEVAVNRLLDRREERAREQEMKQREVDEMRRRESAENNAERTRKLLMSAQRMGT